MIQIFAVYFCFNYIFEFNWVDLWHVLLIPSTCKTNTISICLSIYFSHSPCSNFLFKCFCVRTLMSYSTKQNSPPPQLIIQGVWWRACACIHIRDAKIVYFITNDLDIHCIVLSAKAYIILYIPVPIFVFTSKNIGLWSVFCKACILPIGTLTNLKQKLHFTTKCPQTPAGKNSNGFFKLDLSNERSFPVKKFS